MNSAIGREALEFIDSLLTEEEIEDSNKRVELIGETIKQKARENELPNVKDEQVLISISYCFLQHIIKGNIKAKSEKLTPKLTSR